MTHYILRTLFSLMLIAFPSVVLASSTTLAASSDAIALEAVTDEPGEASIELHGNMLHVQNAQGLALEVYDITGKRVMMVRIDSNDKKISLNLGKGCYIVRVGKITRKIAIA